MATRAMPKHRRGSPAALHESLAEVLGAERLARLAETARLSRAWPDMVGPMLAARTRPVAIEGDTLLIAVDHPAMAQQIRFLHDEIRAACFRQCRIRRVRRIRTRLEPGAGLARPAERAAPPSPPSLNARKRAARMVRPVADKPLRHAMYRAILAQWARAPDDR